MKTDLMPFWVFDEDLDKALEEIANGSTSDGYNVLSHFVHKIETGQTPDLRSMNFILDALKKIITTHDAGKEVDYEMIFSMKMSRKRPPLSAKGSYDRALKYGGEITQLLKDDENKKVYEAIQEVADKYKKTAKNIQEYYTKYNHIIEG